MYQSVNNYAFSGIGNTISGEGSVFPRTADMVFSNAARTNVFFVTDNDNDAITHNETRAAHGQGAFWAHVTVATPKSPASSLLLFGLS